MSRPAQQLVTSPEAWRVMISPARMEIIEAMRCLAPCSIAELAELLDRPADGLYQHVAALRRIGVIVGAGHVKRGKHIETVLDLSADDYRIDFADDTGDSERAALVETVGTFCRAMTRCTAKAADAKALKLGPGERNLVIEYDLTWLDAQEYAELRRLLTAVHALCDKGRRKHGRDGAERTEREAGTLFSVLCMAMPVVRSRHAKGVAKGNAKNTSNGNGTGTVTVTGAGGEVAERGEKSKNTKRAVRGTKPGGTMRG